MKVEISAKRINKDEAYVSLKIDGEEIFVSEKLSYFDKIVDAVVCKYDDEAGIEAEEHKYRAYYRGYGKIYEVKEYLREYETVEEWINEAKRIIEAITAWVDEIKYKLKNEHTHIEFEL